MLNIPIIESHNEYICVYIYLYIYIYIHVFIYMYMCVCMCVCVCVCVKYFCLSTYQKEFLLNNFI